ncbi:MAG: YkoF family thiamine/hydroxymethylpyrimidine-binding protein [Rubripirellula sp.]
MVITVEISMYPFREEFRSLIKDFIRKLNEIDGLKIASGSTSTVIIGDYDLVMDTLKEMFRWSLETHGKAVFVTKFLPGYQPSE